MLDLKQTSTYLDNIENSNNIDILIILFGKHLHIFFLTLLQLLCLYVMYSDSHV